MRNLQIIFLIIGVVVVVVVLADCDPECKLTPFMIAMESKAKEEEVISCRGRHIDAFIGIMICEEEGCCETYAHCTRPGTPCIRRDDFKYLPAIIDKQKEAVKWREELEKNGGRVRYRPPPTGRNYT